MWIGPFAYGKAEVTIIGFLIVFVAIENKKKKLFINIA